MQKRSSTCICELCQRNEKCFDSVFELEVGNSEIFEPVEIKVVSTSSQTKSPSSLASLNGNICILAIHGIVSHLICQMLFG